MKFAQLRSIGPAEQSVHCIEVPDPGPPGAGEVVIDLVACPVNPADILLIEGNYAVNPTPPCGVGIEGAGIVAAIGPGVTGLEVGDPVMSLCRTNWIQRIRDQAHSFVRLPKGIDMAQAAMLKVNAATAHMLLIRYVELKSGEWVIQNVANSGVGMNLIQLARAEGIRTVNIVRRAELIDELKQSGADVVVVDGPDLAQRVEQETGGAAIRLGIDAVAGSATGRLAQCVSEGGTVVNYGLMSGDPIQLDAAECVFRDIRLVGFWLAKVMRTMPLDQIQAMYGKLAQRLMDGSIHVPVEASYPLEKISEAMAHAKRASRGGKVQLRPNG